MGYGWVIAQIVIAIVSAVYQIQQAKKQKDEAKKAAEARKGFEVPVEGEASFLPTVYGRAKIGGIRVWHDTKGGFDYPYGNENADRVFLAGLSTSQLVPTVRFETRGGYTQTFWNTTSTDLDQSWKGKKNEYLFFQQALCQGPIQSVWDIIVDESRFLNDPVLGSDEFRNWDDPAREEAAQRVDCYFSGGVSCNVITENFNERSDAIFKDMAFISSVTRIDREQPQHSGIPVLQGIIEGKKLPVVQKVGTDPNWVYQLAKSGNDLILQYDTSPALVLLDYLMDNISGKGISEEYIDLESFYNADQVCRRIVLTDARVAGKIWQPTYGTAFGRNISTRDLPLYECNYVVDPKRTVRENIESILATMGDARLVWSGGKYKLSLQYPATNNDIILAGTLTDDDLILDQEVDIIWPTAAERLNHCTVRFNDEAENFKENSISWPPKLNALSGSETPKSDTRLIGIGGFRYPHGQHHKGWKTTVNGLSPSLLNNYAVWEGTAHIAEVTYKFVIRPEEQGTFDLNIVADDKVIDWNLYEDGNPTPIYSGVQTDEGFGPYVTHGWKTTDTTSVDLGHATLDKVYRLVISGEDYTDQLPDDEGSATKSRGIAATLTIGNKTYWSTREPAWQDFKEVTLNNAVYIGFLQEDNDMPLETEIYAEGITDVYHAQAKAEELVRTSRGAFSVKIKYKITDKIFEPGDFIAINSETLKLGEVSTVYFRVNSISISDDFIAELELGRFDASFLAWNVPDDAYYKPPVIYNEIVPAPFSVKFVPSPTDYQHDAIGRLEWDAAYFAEFSHYEVHIHTDLDYVDPVTGVPSFHMLGTTADEFMIIPPLLGQWVVFGVKTVSRSGRKSVMAFADVWWRGDGDVKISPYPIPPWWEADDLIADPSFKLSTEKGLFWNWIDRVEPIDHNMPLLEIIEDGGLLDGCLRITGTYPGSGLADQIQLYDIRNPVAKALEGDSITVSIRLRRTTAVDTNFWIFLYPAMTNDPTWPSAGEAFISSKWPQYIFIGQNETSQWNLNQWYTYHETITIEPDPAWPNPGSWLRFVAIIQDFVGTVEIDIINATKNISYTETSSTKPVVTPDPDDPNTPDNPVLGPDGWVEQVNVEKEVWAIQHELPKNPQELQLWDKHVLFALSYRDPPSLAETFVEVRKRFDFRLYGDYWSNGSNSTQPLTHYSMIEIISRYEDEGVYEFGETIDPYLMPYFHAPLTVEIICEFIDSDAVYPIIHLDGVEAGVNITLYKDVDGSLVLWAYGGDEIPSPRNAIRLDTIISNNTFYHFALTLDRNQVVRVYVNGVKQTGYLHSRKSSTSHMPGLYQIKFGNSGTSLLSATGIWTYPTWTDDLGPIRSFRGNIKDIRVSSIIRWMDDFTPPNDWLSWGFRGTSDFPFGDYNYPYPYYDYVPENRLVTTSSGHLILDQNYNTPDTYIRGEHVYQKPLLEYSWDPDSDEDPLWNNNAEILIIRGDNNGSFVFLSQQTLENDPNDIYYYNWDGLFTGAGVWNLEATNPDVKMDYSNTDTGIFFETPLNFGQQPWGNPQAPGFSWDYFSWPTNAEIPLFRFNPTNGSYTGSAIRDLTNRTSAEPFVFEGFFYLWNQTNYLSPATSYTIISKKGFSYTDRMNAGSSLGGVTDDWALYKYGSEICFAFYYNGVWQNAKFTGFSNWETWIHIAVERDSNDVITIYVDGVAGGTTATIGSGSIFNTVDWQIAPREYYGVATTTSSRERFRGYLTELRFTWNANRYNGNFTSPTDKFPCKGYELRPYLTDKEFKWTEIDRIYSGKYWRNSQIGVYQDGEIVFKGYSHNFASATTIGKFVANEFSPVSFIGFEDTTNNPNDVIMTYFFNDGVNDLPAIQIRNASIYKNTSGTTTPTWVEISGGGSSTLAALTDTAITSPANTEVLTYNSTSGKWENATAPSGGNVVGGLDTIFTDTFDNDHTDWTASLGTWNDNSGYISINTGATTAGRLVYDNPVSHFGGMVECEMYFDSASSVTGDSHCAIKYLDDNSATGGPIVKIKWVNKANPIIATENDGTAQIWTGPSVTAALDTWHKLQVFIEDSAFARIYLNDTFIGTGNFVGAVNASDTDNLGIVVYNGTFRFRNFKVYQKSGIAAGTTLPTTTKGDLVVHNGSTDIRLPVGTNTQLLSADSAEASGVKWVDAPTGGGSPTAAYEYITEWWDPGKRTGINAYNGLGGVSSFSQGTTFGTGELSQTITSTNGSVSTVGYASNLFSPGDSFNYLFLDAIDTLYVTFYIKPSASNSGNYYKFGLTNSHNWDSHYCTVEHYGSGWNLVTYVGGSSTSNALSTGLTFGAFNKVQLALTSSSVIATINDSTGATNTTNLPTLGLHWATQLGTTAGGSAQSLITSWVHIKKDR